MEQPSAWAPNCKSPHLSAHLSGEVQYSHSTGQGMPRPTTDSIFCTKSNQPLSLVYPQVT